MALTTGKFFLALLLIAGLVFGCWGPVAVTGDTNHMDTFAGQYLQIAIRSTVACTVNYSGYTCSGGELTPFSKTYIVTAANATGAVLRDYQTSLPDGELFNLSVQTSTLNIQRGQCFVRGEIINSAADTLTPTAILFSDYLTTNSPLAFPGSPVTSSTSGRGYLYTLQYPNPAAGTQFLHTVPANVIRKVNQIFVSLTTAAIAGDRHIAVDIRDATPSFIALIPSQVIQPISLTYYYSFNKAIGVQTTFDAVQGFVQDSFPEDVFVFPSYQLRIDVTGLKNTDQLTNPTFSYEEWIADN